MMHPSDLASNTVFLILNYQTYELTLSLVDEMRSDPLYSGVSVLVIDNCSPNASGDILAAQAEARGFYFIQNDTNAGYAAGNNVGLRWASDHGYRFALILNNDVLIDCSLCEGNLLELAGLLDSNEEYGVIGPRVMRPNGAREDPVAFRGSFFDLTLGYPLFYKKRKGFQPNSHLAEYYRPQGCCMMLDLRSMKGCGYMDEHTFLYSEEEILAERLLSIGKKCGFCKDVSIVHNHSVTVRKAFSRAGAATQVCKSYAYYLRAYRGFSPVCTAFCVAVMWIVRYVR